MVLYDAGGLCVAASATGHHVVTRAMVTADAREEHDATQQDQDEGDDPRDFHPAWCAVGARVSHVRVLLSARYHRDSVTRRS